MKKKIAMLLGLVVFLQLLFADVQKVAVLSFDRVDRDSDYVASALMRRDMNNIFRDYDQFELIRQRDVDNVVRATGYTNIYMLGRQEIAEIGKTLDADIVMWGNVESQSASEFIVRVKVWTKLSDDVRLERMVVAKSSRPRIQTIKEELIDKLEEMFGADTDKMMTIAMQHYNSQNWSSAEDAFKRILEVDADSEHAYFYLGYINFRKDMPDYEQSEYYYKEGLKRNPNDANLLNYLSATYLQQRKFDEAIDVLTRLAEQHESRDTWFRIGRIYSTIDEHNNAIDAFDRAIYIDDDFAEAYEEIALLYFDELQDFELAIPYLERAVQFKPDDESLQTKLARSYFQTNRLDSAIEQYKTVIREQPERLSSYYNLARAYRQSGDNELALETLLDLRGRDGENPRLYFSLSDVYLNMENYDEAIEAANQALTLDENAYEPYLMLARVYQNLGYQKYEEFLDLADRATEAYGQEADRLTQQRDRVKEQAHADFTRSEMNLNNAKERTTSASVLRDIERRNETLLQLLDATKRGFF